MKIRDLALTILPATLLWTASLYAVEVHNKHQSKKIRLNQQQVSHSTPTTTKKNNINLGFLKLSPVHYKYNTPEDLLNLIPGVREINRLIPRQFSLADHRIDLDPRSMVISHEFLDSKTRASPKNSIISMTYSSLGRQFGTHLDVPLFYSSIHGFSNWSAYPLGNYTMTINKHNKIRDEILLYIKARTRF